MSRILVLSDLWHPFPGGAEAYIRRVTEALDARGHDVHILTSYAKAKSALPMTIKDIGVYERHKEGAALIGEFVDKFDPEIILTHHFFAGEFAKELSILSFGIPFIEIIHNRPRHSDAAFAIFNSQYTADRAGYREGDLVMLPPATEECVLETAHLMVMSGSPLGLQDCIGHVKPLGGKGIALTYDLARAMPERKFLVLRGEWQDGEDIQRLPNVEFMEPVDDIREFYSRCRLILVPSLSEDAGTVCQEAALNGIPAISSDVGGLPETNAGGIILPPDDFSQWIKEISFLDDPKHYQEIVKQQRLFIASLNWEKQFDLINQKICAL